MIIKFTDFEDGVHDLELSKRADKLGLDERFTGDVLVDCRMDKSHSQIILNCDLSAKADFECDRCLEEFSGIINNSFQLTYLFEQENVQNDTDGVYSLRPDETKIDISEDVQEYTTLATPMKLLCSEDCKGICRKCGANLNTTDCDCKEDVNPIWKDLLKLKNKS